jgi:hypothetical protein
VLDRDGAKQDGKLRQLRYDVHGEVKVFQLEE